MLFNCWLAHVSHHTDYRDHHHLHCVPHHSAMSIEMSEKSSSESEQNDIDDKQTSSSIWMTKELSILQSYIEAYKQEPITKKQKLVQKQVVPQIKAAYGDRYKESSLCADKEINEEWKKKETSEYK